MSQSLPNSAHQRAIHALLFRVKGCSQPKRYCHHCGADTTARDLGRSRVLLQRAAKAVAAADDAIDAYLAGTANRMAKMQRKTTTKKNTGGRT